MGVDNPLRELEESGTPGGIVASKRAVMEKLMIRHATVKDVPAMVPLGRAFHEDSGYDVFVPFDAGKLANDLRKMVRAPNSEVIVLETTKGIQAVAAVTSLESFFGYPKIGVERFLYVEPELRGGQPGIGFQMMQVLEECAYSLGCAVMTMISLERLEPTKANALYERCGYTLVEHVWMKKL